MRSTSNAQPADRSPAASAQAATRGGPETAPASLDASPRLLAQRQQIQRSFGPAATGPVAQRAISLETLESKLQSVKEEGGSYSGTLDDNTSPDVANAVGESWAGEGAKLTYYGASAWDSRVSADDSRQYRPPMKKMSGQAQGSVQANYEAKLGREGGFNFNAHVTITGLDDHADWKKKERGEYKPPEKPKPEASSDSDDDEGGLFGDLGL